MKTNWTVLWVAWVFLSVSALEAKEIVKNPLEVAGRKASAIQEKRVVPQQWSSGKSLSLTEKRIPMEAWSKHFSSVGSKRAPIEMRAKAQSTVEVTRRKFPKQSRPMARMDRQMARIKKEAGIHTKDRPLILREQQVYAMMLQGAVFEQAMQQQLSLRDLNRFQFRRNRSDAPVPIKPAGSGER